MKRALPTLALASLLALPALGQGAQETVKSPNFDVVAGDRAKAQEKAAELEEAHHHAEHEHELRRGGRRGRGRRGGRRARCHHGSGGAGGHLRAERLRACEIPPWGDVVTDERGA